MRISNWMQSPVITIKPHDSVGHARDLMSRERINQLPVVKGKELVGIVTDRDVRDATPSVYEYARGDADAAKDPDRIHVEDIMTADVLTIGPDKSVGDAAAVMQRERIGALPVIEAGEMIGILARSDILRAFTSAEAEKTTARA